MKKTKLFASVVVFAAASASFGGVNLLQNGDFAAGRAGWTDRTNPKQAISFENGVMKATITDGSSKNEGQVVQFRDARPNAVYRVSAKVRGEIARFGYLQVKEMKGKKEGERHISDANATAGDWCTVSKDIASTWTSSSSS